MSSFASTQSTEKKLSDSAQNQLPLHVSEGQNVQRQILHNKFLEARTNFASPTDNLMSPCTAKLQAHKKKHYTKTKPQLLRFGNLAAVAAAGKENSSERPSRFANSGIFGS
ncbi:uncharacterized protein V2V93DRAFT_368016 [Kockiozyma suomiensis]|uniref:uncharacterized protein n=1 Tax=Kockiozyma suomiensis TaxID=1337062 RepID=UPI003343CB01